MRQRQAAIVGFALSVLGFGIAAYLTALHYTTMVELVCPSGGLIDCETVLTSPQSVVLGLPVAAYGLVWFAVNALLQALGLQKRGLSSWLRWVSLVWLAVGAVTVVYLVYVELNVVGKVCIWCTGVHLIILLLVALRVLSDHRESGGVGDSAG